MQPSGYSSNLGVEPWPPDGLDLLGYCPLCGSRERGLLHKNLIDKIFFCADGHWDMWLCANCKSAYLDPRPDPVTISRAYRRYFTHDPPRLSQVYASLNPYRKIRRRIANGYINTRYGTSAQPSSKIGFLTTCTLPNMKKRIDRRYRHMTKPPKTGGLVLDLGCGNGSFLKLAQFLGWRAVGLDTDPSAVTNASRLGMTVYQGGIEFFHGKRDLFDLITMNHLIEHVHNPSDVLKSCYALLKPDGKLWLETPNIASMGYKRFRRNWFGLDAPRHLVLFNHNSILKTLVTAGFQDIRFRPTLSSSTRMIYKRSYLLESGHSPYESECSRKFFTFQALIAYYIGVFLRQYQESIIVTARKKIL